jgi:hypothetical protein
VLNTNQYNFSNLVICVLQNTVGDEFHYVIECKKSYGREKVVFDEEFYIET